MLSALRDRQTAHGARFREYSGHEVAACFGSSAPEYAAVRETVGLLDLTWRSLLRVTGPDSASFLHSMTTNHVLDLGAGASQRTTACDVKGHLVGVMRLANAGDAYWLDMHPGCTPGVLAILEKHLIMEEVEIAELHSAWGILSLQGPDSARALAGIEGAPACPPQRSLVEWTFGGKPALLLGSSHTGAAGVDLIAPEDTIGSLWEALLDSVTAAGGSAVGLEALNALRIEAGIPWWGEELDNSILMLEAGMDDAIHYNKGCYLGQETLARVHFRGHTNRQLAGILLPAGPLPSPRTRLVGGEKDAGWITSAVYSPAIKRNIALAFVRREFLEPGAQLTLETGGSAAVAALPFVEGSAQPSGG